MQLSVNRDLLINLKPYQVWSRSARKRLRRKRLKIHQTQIIVRLKVRIYKNLQIVAKGVWHLDQ